VVGATGAVVDGAVVAGTAPAVAPGTAVEASVGAAGVAVALVAVGVLAVLELSLLCETRVKSRKATPTPKIPSTAIWRTGLSFSLFLTRPTPQGG
jgi:hypothetical protein